MSEVAGKINNLRDHYMLDYGYFVLGAIPYLRPLQTKPTMLETF